MNEYPDLVPRGVAYRWLAQFFVHPPVLEKYRGKDGQEFLAACRTSPALASSAAMIQEALTSEVSLKKTHARFARTFSQAFDVGGPRSAPPYASVYLSERGLLCQQPTRDMNRILDELQMALPDAVNEPSDHLAVQLHVAAELFDREVTGGPVPLSSKAFLEMHVLSWLPMFLKRCEALPDPVPIAMFVRSVLTLVSNDVEAAGDCREAG